MVHCVDAESLAALLVLDRTLEPCPEPFRMQPSLTLSVSFDEYCKFVRTLPDTPQYLFNPLPKLWEKLERGEVLPLVKAFYTDMAGAVGKELFYAEYAQRPATTIRHTFDDVHLVPPPEIDPKWDKVLRHLLGRKNYTLPAQVSMCNQHHWQYALRLLSGAATTPCFWVDK